MCLQLVGPQENMTPWLVVVSAVLGSIVVVDLGLYFVAWVRPSVKQAGQPQTFSDMQVRALPFPAQAHLLRAHA